MLVLERKEGQKIVVGNGLVTVTVVRVRGGKVKVGIEAPRELTVNREEVQRYKQRRNGERNGHAKDGQVEGDGNVAS